MIDVTAINAFIISQEINHGNGNICIRQRKQFLSVFEKMCGITKKLQPVAPISARRKINVTLDANSASLNKRDRCTLCDRKKNRKCQSLCSKCGKCVCPEHSDIVCINCV